MTAFGVSKGSAVKIRAMAVDIDGPPTPAYWLDLARRASVRLTEAPSHRKTIFEYAPRSSGAADYSRLAERVLQDG